MSLWLVLAQLLTLGANGFEDQDIANRLRSINQLLKCALPEGSNSFAWDKLDAALRGAYERGHRQPALDLSRTAFSVMEQQAVEKIRWAEVRLLLPDRKEPAEQAHFFRIYLEEAARYGLEKEQSDRLQNSYEDPTRAEVNAHMQDFCIFSYFAAINFLISHDADERQRYVHHMCQLLSAVGIHWMVLILWAHVRLVSPSDVLRNLERHGISSCALRSVPLSSPLPSPSLSFKSQRRALQVVLWSGHQFAWDSLMASQAAAVEEDMAWKGLILGFGLAEKHAVAKENCKQIGAYLEADSLCQHSEVLRVGLEVMTTEGLGTENGLPLNSGKRILDAARAEFPVLRVTDLLICSYPYVLCPILGTYKGFKDIAMLTVVKGAGSMAEYAHASLVPWILGIYRRWITGKDPNSNALRKVVFADAIDPAIVQATFGDHITVPSVHFSARYVLHLAGGCRCDLRSQSKTLLIWRLFSIFPGLESMAMLTILSSVVHSPPAGWEVELLQDTIEFTYKDLQRFSAILQVPWDWALVSFQEFLALGIPVILPKNDFMHSLIATVYWSRMANHTVWSTVWKRRFLQLVPEDWEGFELGASNKSLKMTEEASYAPDGSMLDHVAYWWEHTEYAKQSIVKTFESMTDLYVVLARLDPEVICERLQRQTRRKLRQSRQFHQRLLRELQL